MTMTMTMTMISIQSQSSMPITLNLTSSSSSSSSSASTSVACCSDQTPFRNARVLLVSPKSPNPISLVSSNHRHNPLLRLCRASLSRRDGDVIDYGDDRYLQASLLVSETVKHYSMWKQGFVEDTKWHTPGQRHLLSHQRKENMSDARSIGHGILRRFQSPTIFLKIACDGDLLLPIFVGEFTITQLIDSLNNNQNEESPDRFQFAKNIVLKFGYEVKMVRITERVVNTYHALIDLAKPTDYANISIDARPSDAINVAERFKAPIYVSREIVLKDAIKIVYGKWRGSGKTVYDVSLDSAVEGHDPLSEEIYMIQKMKTAVLEERYEDAVTWRDKLAKFHVHSHEL